ncbi:MAG TPA: FG-GAP-like repeat-containing protein, partial [Saprospiraceae bacterium]|nr:FG-GAP-like repeat-containing protein [Saprospiraceae bacterium]
LPPGTAGVKPNLSITYNSNGGDGIMGMGFNCDAMSFISRTGNTFDMDGWNLGVQLNQYDKLSVNGERLIQTNPSTSNSYLKSGANYITKNQNFTKYVAVGEANEDPDYYIAYTKSGEKMYFGSSSDSRIAGITGVTSFWLLKRVEDQFGNYFEYEYYNRIPNLTVQANEFYPIKIKYTGNNLLTPYCSIDFTYTNRSNPIKPSENYNGGIFQINTKKLSEIKVSYLDTLIKKYVITYDSSAVSKILRVRSIQEYGMNGKHFHPTVFNWDENENISNFSESNKLTLISKSLCNNQAVNGSPAPASAGFTKYLQTDFNGDGLIDYCVYNIELDSVYIFLNQDGAFTLSIASRIHQLFNAVTNDDVTAGNTFSASQVYFEDMNGDNATDFIFVKHSTGFNRITYVDPSFDRSNISILQEETPNVFTNIFGDIAGTGTNIKQISFVDIDGNGLPEVFVYRPNTGTNWFYTKVVDPLTQQDLYQKTDGPLVLAPGIPANTEHRFLDINGDGNAELLWAVRVNNQFVLKINKMLAPITHYFSQTDSLVQYGEIVTITFPFDNGVSTSILNENIYFTELNGDGLPDFSYAINGILHFYINTGSFNFKQRGSFTLDSGRIPVFADLNSDGRFDFLQLKISDGTNNWKINQGFTSLTGNLQFISDPGNNGLPSGAITGCTPRFLSFRKNSFVDVLFINQCTTIPSQKGTNYWWQNNYKPGFKVNEVINGLGLKNKVTYTTTGNQNVYKPYISTENLLPELIFVITGNPIYEHAKIEPFEYTGRMPIVQEYQIDNGYNGINKLSYKYQRAIMDRSGAGFRGFQRVIIKDETSKLITVKKFGLTIFGIMSEFENYTMLEGKSEPINRTYSIDSIFTKTIANTFNYPGNVTVTHNYESYFQYNKSSEKLNFDLDGTFASWITSVNQVDTFGNVLRNVIDYNDGFVDTLTNFYSNNTNLWHLGRLTRSELKRKSPDGPAITRVSSFEYSPTTGILKKEIVEPDIIDTLRIEKNY